MANRLQQSEDETREETEQQQKKKKKKPKKAAVPHHVALNLAARTVSEKPDNATLATSPHQRHGDRGSADDAAASQLRRWIRFKDLAHAGVVSNWPQLLNLIAEQGFPRGKLIGPNSRAWLLHEVEAWLDQRPTEHERGTRDREQCETELRATELRAEIEKLEALGETLRRDTAPRGEHALIAK
jgi:predicted DNA-binding transcriptional regulator AlpA